jgi:mRNA-degrading endonuclease YafQ of YafQ-DinJ toxin-antitoxin module
MTWRVEYTNEFVARFRELNFGQRFLVEDSIRSIVSLDDPTILAYRLERRAYFCNWSHRVRANLIVVFRISKRSLTFISTGTHSQAYRPSA